MPLKTLGLLSEPVTFWAAASHTLAVASGATALSVVVFQADVMLPLAGLFSGFALLFYLRRSLSWKDRLFYAFASFAAALPFVWAASDVAEAYWPAMPGSARIAVGFLCMMLALPFVSALRAGTKMIEDNPGVLLKWVNRRLPEKLRFKVEGKDRDDG